MLIMSRVTWFMITTLIIKSSYLILMMIIRWYKKVDHFIMVDLLWDYAKQLGNKKGETELILRRKRAFNFSFVPENVFAPSSQHEWYHEKTKTNRQINKEALYMYCIKWLKLIYTSGESFTNLKKNLNTGARTKQYCWYILHAVLSNVCVLYHHKLSPKRL